MLFNSGEFVFLFLPLALIGYYALRRWTKGGNIPLAFLVLVSLFFYGWWDPKYLLVILSSIAINYQIGRTIIRWRQNALSRAKALLTLGIALNLGGLGYFKYSSFLMDNLGALLGTDYHFAKVILPLAISFFTFQQIAYLVDAYRAECDDYDFTHYCLFVTFFPQLIAGPIVHHAEMMPQFLKRSKSDFYHDAFIGISFFVFGLAKKVLFADTVAEWSSPVFAAADAGQPISTTEAWGGALAYSLQLYFDFSGYADMAIGAARLFGIQLPLNFNSPYQSVSIIEFWRRWHMTLSRFLRDYLYIPLGGNRNGTVNRHRNLFITMLLGGLWHGAGWNFVIWGALHGVYLIVNHLFQSLRPSHWTLPNWLGRPLSQGLTLFCVIIAWVFFRAETFEGATQIVTTMFSVQANHATDVWLTEAARGWKHIALLSVIALFLPNTSRLTGYFGEQAHSSPLWKPGIVTGLIISLLFVATAIRLSDISEFLYFQF